MPPPALRHYQERVVDGLLKAPRGGIAMMATGAGKTFVAAEVLRRLLGDDPTNRAVFVVPAVPLVQQQRAALSEYYFGDRVVGVSGDCLIPDHQILVITHGSFSHAVESGACALGCYKCIVFDEVHHCRGNHTYRLIARMLTESFPSVRVVGLTASIAYGTNEGDIARDIATLLDDLGLEEDGSTIFAVDDDELKADGFRPEMELDRDVEKFTEHARQYQMQLEDHKLVESFFDEYRSEMVHPFTYKLVDFTRDLEASLRSELDRVDGDSGWREFTEHLALGKRDPPAPLLADWERSLRSMGDTPVVVSLGLCYAALRIIIASSQRDLDLATAYIRQKVFALDWTGVDFSKLTPILLDSEMFFRRVEALYLVLRERQASRAKVGKDFRAIVFVRLQSATIILSREMEIWQAQEHSEFQPLKPHHFTSTKEAATFLEKGMSPTQQADVLQKFRDGEYNVLIATTVAEEGLDVTGVDLVVFFDPKDNLVSYVQSMGRARDNCSKVVVLGERKAVQYFETAKSLQYEVLKEPETLRAAPLRSQPKPAESSPTSPLSRATAPVVQAALALLSDDRKDVKMRLAELEQKFNFKRQKSVAKQCKCMPSRGCQYCPTTEYVARVEITVPPSFQATFSSEVLTFDRVEKSKSAAENACSSDVKDALISRLTALQE